MTPKEAKAMEKMLGPCRKCGGKLFVSGYTRESSTGLQHILIRCKKCGDWFGGLTSKKRLKGANDAT